MAIAALGFADAVSAQKDAAEKAKEGAIEHWIEYYRSEQRKPAAVAPRERVASPADLAAPVERTESDATPREETERK